MLGIMIKSIKYKLFDKNCRYLNVDNTTNMRNIDFY